MYRALGYVEEAYAYDGVAGNRNRRFFEGSILGPRHAGRATAIMEGVL